ncbi:UNVERIFIED_ORG: hypothetical protein M2438_001216 [Methylobacterium sp. SuP10 SLI 274]|uniref:STN domain-containing protein n=1 Tax=Methylorubrum extorquens TaxID=408 RepID=UPI0020A16545|nr:STN domain-containing protein [Methylorubrum extorquens]MDF9862427.1 hypothetical protein [Methylorubrum pseudosasae]MDH6636041.1 hypothetical protein [Methylobacterium sp. SuP10 SLI 274]MDH6665215.1 hypothetical protein [Methylorubrum zatmanii]MCP1557142.1 hypothetical protein [Methylorubrum extorquens]MDF9790720.1 hypothetical protein [Methylorubrum extorquens]
MGSRPGRTREKRLAWAAAVGVMLTTGSGRAEEVRVFDFPRGPLATVLTRIALQGRRSIVFPADLARGRMVGPIRSYETVEAALARALAGTDLQIAKGAGGSLTVRRVAARSAAAGTDDLASAAAPDPSGAAKHPTGARP